MLPGYCVKGKRKMSDPDNVQDDRGEMSQYVIDEGLSRCESCGRLVPAQAVFDNGFTYILQDCPFEKKSFKRLKYKGKWNIIRWQKTPSYWPWRATDKEKGLDWSRPDPRRPILALMMRTECSARCRICEFVTSRVNKEKPAGLDVAAAKRTIAAHRGRMVSFCMAEPTENPSLAELISFASKRKLITVISTNGLKLSDGNYLKSLKDAGLRYIYMSFDGFDADIYERIRGGKHQYYLKLQAFENVKNEKMKAGIKAVLVKGVNDNQVDALLQYALRNNFVTEVSLQSLSLGGKDESCGFTKEHLLSVEDIKSLINTALCLSEDQFDSWNKIKIGLAAVIAKFPFIRISPFEFDAMYLIRKKDKLVPVFDGKRLERIASLLGDGKITGLIRAGFCLPASFFRFLLKEMLFKRRLLETTDDLLLVRIRTIVSKPYFFSYSGMLVHKNMLTP